jgi:quinoprotein glucose dehydrogenase
VHHTGEISDGSVNPTRTAYECTPLVVNALLYLTTPYNRLLALDPESGVERWGFDPKLDLSKRYNLWANRGPAYWTDGTDRRIVYGTLDGRLISLDADTGAPSTSFGDRGQVQVDVRLTSPPAIAGDLVIIGGNAPVMRAYDVRSGKLAWTFHKVPPEDERARATWAGDSWKNRREGVAWPPLSVDESLGLVYVPTDSPTYDYYGGDRGGDNLYSNCVLALEMETGKLRWHFQVSHHDIWDYDMPAQPVLCDIRQGDSTISAVAQITKQGFIFVLNRKTGEPVFGVEERAVPQKCAPGEQPAATQPFPLKPAPFVRQSATLDELATVTPEHHAWARELASRYELAPLYHPGTPEGVIIFPSNQGGGEWGGACFDPETGRLYVNGTNLGDILVMEPQPGGGGPDGEASGRELVTQEGVTESLQYRRARVDVEQNKFWDPATKRPCQQPPWGVLKAIDLASGDDVWEVPLGIDDELAARGVPQTGTINMGGPIITAGGLVFIGGSNDERFRAFDCDTGQELWVTRLEGSGHANPMTYLGPKSDKQFVVIAAGGGNKLSRRFSDALEAFSLE